MSDDSADRRVLDPPRLVEVLADGAWWPGTCSEWQRWPEGWRAFCRWSTGTGATFVKWLRAEQVRPR